MFIQTKNSPVYTGYINKNDTFLKVFFKYTIDQNYTSKKRYPLKE